jgi:hypothetical protein
MHFRQILPAHSSENRGKTLFAPERPLSDSGNGQYISNLHAIPLIGEQRNFFR